MISKEFIIKQIDKLIERFPYLKARYEMDSFSKSHYIEILPIQCYKGDKSYISEEQRIISHFIKEFPFESLTFLSEGDLYVIEDLTYLKKGWAFDLNQISFVDTVLNLDSFGYIKNKSLALTEFFPQTSQKMSYEFSSMKFEYSNRTTFDNIEYFQDVKKTEVAGNYQYAMAA